MLNQNPYQVQEQQNPENINPISPSHSDLNNLGYDQNLGKNYVPIAIVERLQAIDDLCSIELKKFVSKISRSICDSFEAVLAVNECLHYTGNPEAVKKFNSKAIETVKSQRDALMKLIE